MKFFNIFKKNYAIDRLIRRFKRGKDLDFEEYLKLGDYYRENGFYAKALRVHLSLDIKKDLTDLQRARLNKSLGLDYLNLYQYKEAIDRFIKADNYYKGEDEETRNGLLKAYEFSGDWDSACELKKEILISNKIYSEEKMARYYLYAAEDLIKRENHKKAKKFLREALKLMENINETYYFLAEVEENLIKKLEYYEKISDKFPYLVYRKLVKLKEKFFEQGKMLELFNFVKKSENTYLKAFLVSLLIQKGEYEEAKSIIKNLISENDEIFLNIYLLIQSVELNLEEETLKLVRRIERDLKELTFICTSCKKEFKEYRFRCENCGKTKKLVLKINI
ncbi:MAG: hypothetical protein ABDH37_00320 [Candidatus Hydrothermales bacterium]